jgi:protocatechuate 3,4-dioxygenase beta subunit
MMYSKECASVAQTIKLNPKDQKASEHLHDLMTAHYLQLTQKERSEYRQLLASYSNWPNVTTYDEKEPGTRIQIKGQLLNEKKEPVPGATLFIFQTDSRGYYAPDDSIRGRMNEPDPRLFGYLRSDATGHFEINTIRPASYPKPYNGRLIPQHMHINITVPGYAQKNVQMVFQDDPAMNDYWQKWARDLDYPILYLNYPLKGYPTGLLNITIKKGAN